MAQRSLSVRGLAGMAFISLLSFSTFVIAGDVNPQASPPAEHLVQEALHREVFGLQRDRERLLLAALEQNPDYGPAHWHQGFVKFRGNWTSVDSIPQLVAEFPAIEQYRRQREKCADDLNGNLEMANWCRKHHLASQERAHLNRMLDFAPDHPSARTRLGYRLRNGQWKTDASVREENERAEARRVGLVRWRGKVERLRSGLRSRDEEKRARAEAGVRAIKDPSAIAALEAVFSDTEGGMLLVVDTVAQFRGDEAVETLVRHAVLSGWDSVRHAAARALGQRELESYVPSMLTAMYTPVTSQTAIVPTGNNRFVYRHAFVREGQDQQQELILNTQVRRVARPGGNGRETLLRALVGTMQTYVARERSVELQNQRAGMQNQRISAALNVATGQQLDAKPESWWDWWNQEQDIEIRGQKQSRQIQRNTQVTLADRVPPSNLDGGIQRTGSGRPQSGECFAAGTPVWTAAGLVPIERVRIGDLALSQDPKTGELAYKPVLRTTVRSAEKLHKIHVGSESFETSGGHLFWVSGNGWTRSRQLDTGMNLHSLTGSVPILEIGEGCKAETFNLVVEDFHTYFVGVSRVLSHDVTIRESVETVVPGLVGP